MSTVELHSPFLSDTGSDADNKFKVAFYAQLSNLDDSITDETKDKWYEDVERLFGKPKNTNLDVLTRAFIIRARMTELAGTKHKKNSVPQDPNKFLTAQLELASRNTDTMTDLYKYYLRLTSDTK